jgi:hypothetical protein
LGLREWEAVVATYGSCGCIGTWWIKGKATCCGYFEKSPANVERRAPTHPTPKLDELLEEHRPVVVVNLSTNYVNVPAEAAVVADLRAIAGKISAAVTGSTLVSPPRFPSPAPGRRRF